MKYIYQNTRGVNKYLLAEGDISIQCEYIENHTSENTGLGYLRYSVLNLHSEKRTVFKLYVL